ncbi:hypothetical protein [Candidatus Xianfuyuplasma coldseepsis]|uniref:Uncharacterized protein n=1 Tax=Candidatus Xianfuyuplasma coldseepsis TaxID=2782163 RepID=A0A7L7KPQ4_9MOLU|nr:hypothetical protein [Xianfuyuplasma coldseepsis]QMS84545.1 hypothetical protein G4Z02_01875 [Xianfuyuplasma coldseepsis]
MYERPSRFFLSEIGVIAFAVISLLFGSIAAGASMGIGLAIAVLMIIASFLLMIFMIVLSFIFIVKHIKDKDKDQFPLGHAFNFIFSLGVFIGAGFFYLIIFMGIWVVLAPFFGA